MKFAAELPATGPERIVKGLQYARGEVFDSSQDFYGTLGLIHAARVNPNTPSLSGSIPIGELTPLLKQRLILSVRLGEWESPFIQYLREPVRDRGEQLSLPSEPTEWFTDYGQRLKLSLEQNKCMYVEMKSPTLHYRTFGVFSVPPSNTAVMNQQIRAADGQVFAWRLIGAGGMETAPLPVYAFDPNAPFVTFAEFGQLHPEFIDRSDYTPPRVRP